MLRMVYVASILLHILISWLMIRKDELGQLFVLKCSSLTMFTITSIRPVWWQPKLLIFLFHVTPCWGFKIAIDWFFTLVPADDPCFFSSATCSVFFNHFQIGSFMFSPVYGFPLLHSALFLLWSDPCDFNYFKKTILKCDFEYLVVKR